MQTAGANEKTPTLAPTGTTVACESDVGGSRQLSLGDLTGSLPLPSADLTTTA